MPSFEKTSSVCQGNLPQVRIVASSSRKCRQLFLYAHNETLSIAAMRIGGKFNLSRFERIAFGALER
jgi:hypothetical protein